MRDDFPTLLRPIKAYSGHLESGHPFTSGLLIRYLACVIFIFSFAKVLNLHTTSFNKLKRLGGIFAT